VYGRINAIGVPDVNGAFDLHIVREDLDVAYADDSGGGPLALRRIGISFYERIDDASRMGVRIGGAGLTQTDRPSTAGLDPSGYYGELEFQGAWPAEGRLRFALDASWRYTRVDARDNADNPTVLGWQTFDLRPGLLFGITPRIAGRVGASGLFVDGSERVSSPDRQTVDFEADGRTGAFAGLDFYGRGGDVVHLRLRGGNPEGIYVSFEQRY